MPFCVKCGHQVGDDDKYCAKCGTGQKGPASSVGRFWDSISIRNAILFCYIPWVGWIASIALLGSPRFRSEQRVRFHAFQGLYIFVAWLMVEWVFSPMIRFSGPFRYGGFGFVPALLHLIVFGAWVFMIIKASHDEDYRLPIVGDLADRSAAEQH